MKYFMGGRNHLEHLSNAFHVISRENFFEINTQNVTDKWVHEPGAGDTGISSFDSDTLATVSTAGDTGFFDTNSDTETFPLSGRFRY